MWGFFSLVPKQLAWLSHLDDVRKPPKESYCNCAQLNDLLHVFLSVLSNIHCNSVVRVNSPQKSQFSMYEYSIDGIRKGEIWRGTNYLDCKDDSLLFFSFLRKLFLW